MSVLIAYGAVCVIAAVLLFVMAFLGSDYDTEADFDTDLDMDANIDMDAAGIEAGEFGGPGILSLKLILFFLIGFGLSGFLAVHFKWPVHHILVAAGGGLVLWFAGYKLLKLLYSQQSNSQLRSRVFAGKQARVTVPIPQGGGAGEIEAVDDATGRSAYFSARAADVQKGYQKGDTVRVKSISGGTAMVE